ncbi:MAG: hypothetical protein WA939_06255, partial [Nodosilinea sp.]
MLLASLGLHGLVLMLPAGSGGEAVIPPPDPEQDSVAITRVPPAGEPDAGSEVNSGATSGATIPVPAGQSAATVAIPQARPQPRTMVPQ